MRIAAAARLVEAPFCDSQRGVKQVPEVRFQADDLHDAMTRMLAALRLTEIPVVEFAGAFARDRYDVRVQFDVQDSIALRRFVAHARRIVGVSDLEITD